MTDYTLPVEEVVAEEAAMGTPQARLEAFADLFRRNPVAWRALWSKAREMAWRNRYVCADYLVHWLRFDSHLLPAGSHGPGVRMPNTYATILGRYLREDPALAPYVRVTKSMYDGLELPEIGGTR